MKEKKEKNRYSGRLNRISREELKLLTRMVGAAGWLVPDRWDERGERRNRWDPGGVSGGWEQSRMSDSCATTPLPPPSGDYANVIINCQCSLFNDSSSRSLNTPNCRDVTKIAIQVHRCVSKLLIRCRGFA